MSNTQLIYILISALCFIPAIICHEVMHGFAAYKLGDTTAKDAGRLTLNPIAHVDIFGTIILPLLLAFTGAPVFGYAKPVPYNPNNFKDKRKGDLIVGLAGPAANLALALVAALIAWLLWPYAQSYFNTLGSTRDFFYYFYLMFLPYFCLINLYLMFFNLIPIPPLDGSSIFAFILPEKYLNNYYVIERYAMPVLLIILFVIPYIAPVNPFNVYLDATAGNLGNLLFPFKIS